MTTNPLQQQSAINASKTAPPNAFSEFHAKVTKNVFNPVKYGAAISKKLTAIIKEGAAEQNEFRADLTEFVQEAVVLVALSSIAVGHKLTSPKDDAAVLLQLEALVETSAKFIPLIEKLYAAEEGLLPKESKDVPIQEPFIETKTEESTTDDDTIGAVESASGELTTATSDNTNESITKRVWTPPSHAANS